MVVSNPATSTTTGWPVGFWASELTHAYDMFQEEGFDITIASPLGGKVAIDSLSDPRDQSGYSKDDKISLRYLQDRDFIKLLDNTKKVSELSSDDYDAIVVAGGQGPMFTFKNATGLQNKFLEFYKKGKVSGSRKLSFTEGKKMMWRTDDMKSCPIDVGFEILAKKFAALIIRDMISLNSTKFNQFLASIQGIRPKVLSIRLKELEESGLIERKIYHERPIRIEYYLTEKGKAVKPILDQMAMFSLRYCHNSVFADGKPRSETTLHNIIKTNISQYV